MLVQAAPSGAENVDVHEDTDQHTIKHEARMADLLRRYPRIEKEEISALLDFLAETPRRRVESLISARHLQPNLGRFRQAHSDRFRATIGERLTMAGVCAAPVALLVYLALQQWS